MYDKFFFSSRRRHTRLQGDWSSDVCSSDLTVGGLSWFRTGGGSICAHLMTCATVTTDDDAGHNSGDRTPVEPAVARAVLHEVVARLQMDDCAVEIGRASCRERA